MAGGLPEWWEDKWWKTEEERFGPKSQLGFRPQARARGGIPAGILPEKGWDGQSQIVNVAGGTPLWETEMERGGEL